MLQLLFFFLALTFSLNTVAQSSGLIRINTRNNLMVLGTDAKGKLKQLYLGKQVSGFQPGEYEGKTFSTGFLETTGLHFDMYNEFESNVILL